MEEKTKYLIKSDPGPDLIKYALTAPEVDPAKLRELLAVRREWMQQESAAAFAADMAEFQSRVRIIERGDVANGRRYARLDRIQREIRPLLREFGFWVTWEKCAIKDEMVELEGTLGHKAGHSVRISQKIPLPDKISGTNAAQRAGSAESYAKRYGLANALGIVTGQDDDGNGGQAVALVSDEQAAAIAELVEESGVDKSKFLGWLDVQRIDQIPASRFAVVCAELKKRIKK